MVKTFVNDVTNRRLKIYKQFHKLNTKKQTNKQLHKKWAEDLMDIFPKNTHIGLTGT